jgi:N-acetylglutamate synthase-like GNAT family acetyltransferase
MDIRIRRAQPNEAETLTEIAYAAKRHWSYPESWIEQWKDELTITKQFIADNDMFVAARGDEILGCCALVAGDSMAELEHMWVRPQDMGSGVGRELFFYARKQAARKGAIALEFSADPNAEGFYVRMGAARVGEVRSEVEGQLRVLPRMRLVL